MCTVTSAELCFTILLQLHRPFLIQKPDRIRRKAEVSLFMYLCLTFVQFLIFLLMKADFFKRVKSTRKK